MSVVIPELSKVRAFAGQLHAAGRRWQGEMFGWSGEYTPESQRKPRDSKMRFTPADFWIGESGIWFFFPHVGAREGPRANGIPG